MDEIDQQKYDAAIEAIRDCRRKYNKLMDDYEERGRRLRAMYAWMSIGIYCDTCGDLAKSSQWDEFVEDRPDATNWFSRGGTAK